MYAIESFCPLLQPGRVEDGPPYGKPGIFIPISYDKSSVADAVEGIKRILSYPDSSRREKYRIALCVKGRVLATSKRWDADGNPILPERKRATTRRKAA